MPISFECPRCGKKLKAPDDAVGKSSRCPDCGTAVICPEPVFDAELIDPVTGEPGFAADEPTPLVGLESSSSPPVHVQADPASASAEPRQPCPMCGELIVVGAARCRFCGEVFDPLVKKAGMGGKSAKIRAVASQQRNLLLCVALQVITMGLSSVLRDQLRANHDPAMALVLMCSSAATVAALIGGSFYAVVLASKFYHVIVVILLGLLSLIPCLGLIFLLIVNSRATSFLRENGYEIGLLGSREP